MPSHNKGFSLVELLVVIAIFALMTGFVALKYGTFSRNILVQNLAYDIALTIREAQSYGVSVSDIGQTGNFNITYGVRFDTATPQTFTLFADLNGNKRFDVLTETVRKYTISNNNKIFRLCHVAVVQPGPTCSQSTSGGAGTYVDVMFQRPSPSPLISSPAVSTAQYIEIVVSNSDQTSMRKVVVRTSGQISIEEL